jgi:hypothetical protein
MRWTHVAYVESDSEPGRQHQIKSAVGGRLGCDCMAFRFAKGTKTCKHLQAYLAGEAMDGQRAVQPAVRSERARVVSNGEAFTVTRRAITFGAVK